MIKQSNGFTVIEILFVVTLLSIASIFFFVQKNNIETAAKDDSRKVAINTIYYNLEEVFFPTNNFYPQNISSDILKSVNPEMFIDTDGKLINTDGSAYSYKPTGCTDNKCKGYSLRTVLKNEGDFIKTNKN